MGHVVFGIIAIIGGGLIIRFHGVLYQTFGPIEWFEKHMGDSRSAYALLGMALIVIGILVLFGMGAGGPTSIDASLTETNTTTTE